jgi:hypothetical protein
MRGLLLRFASLAAAQPGPGPALSVDAGAARHPINPDIYGVNFYWDLGDANDPNHAAYAAAGIEYCGAAPFNMPGLFQVNGRLDAAVAALDAVSVRVIVGVTPSQSGVTLGVR